MSISKNCSSSPKTPFCVCVDVSKEINTQKKNWNDHKMEWAQGMTEESNVTEKFARKTIYTLERKY